ncbi:MAG: L,D-transpeptidase family protein, partial [Rhizobiales bacterium]|nr:L,D-transpeptidase family protein [Hyphomicrobiales bacterium]
MATRDTLMMISRRRLLAGAGLLGGSLLVPTIAAADRIEEIGDLKPGDYTWHPERSPSGPVVVVVSLPDQLTFVYRNGIRIAVSTCSTGKPGHETPTGVFTILQKDRDHHSSLYNDASMPNTERLTWSGVCLHAGGLPGYPSSHGCVHLPLEFSALLFGITTLGTVVIIAGQHDQPADVASSG